MKIISLQAENFKKLVAIEIRPDGNVVEITGKNGQGKTSTLDAIWVALAGLDASPAKPIRKGEAKARIRLDLGEIVVTRKFAANADGTYTSTLTVESDKGAKFPSPQKMLDSLFGALALDPLALLTMEPQDQFKLMQRFVPGVDFAAIEKAHKADFDERTAVNRKSKEAKNAAAALNVGPEPALKVDEAALVEVMQKAGEHNKDIETRRGNRERMAQGIEAKRAQVADIKKQISDWMDLIADATTRVTGVEADIAANAAKLDAAPKLAAPIDTQAIVKQLADARATNFAYSQWVTKLENRKTFLAAAEKFDEESLALTGKMEQRASEKLAKIAEAKLPVPGIGFGDGVITLNDLPFDQASDAEKLRASVAIAMAANPELPVVLIRNGSLLDDDGLKLIAEMADARGAQVWIEKVGNGTVGIVLEDGRVKNIPTLTEGVSGAVATHVIPDEHGLPEHVKLATSYTVVKEEAEIDGVPVADIEAARETPPWDAPNDVLGDDMQEFAPGPGGHDDGELI